MTENLAARGEGLAGRIEEIVCRGKHKRGGPACQATCGIQVQMIIATLEAAVPPSTAPPASVFVLVDTDFEDRLHSIHATEQSAEQARETSNAAPSYRIDKWLVHSAALATPSPQAPTKSVEPQVTSSDAAQPEMGDRSLGKVSVPQSQQEQCNAFSTTSAREQSSATAADRLGAFLAENGVEIKFGLAAQGHIPTVEKMLYEGKTWNEIGNAINWHGPTAKEYYKRHLQRAATQEQPAGSGASNQVSCATCGTTMLANGIPGALYCPKCQPGSPRKVGEDAPFAYVCPAYCGCMWRDNQDGTMSLFGKNSESCSACEPLGLAELIPVYAARPSSVPVGEQKQEEGV